MSLPLFSLLLLPRDTIRASYLASLPPIKFTRWNRFIYFWIKFSEWLTFNIINYFVCVITHTPPKMKMKNKIKLCLAPHQNDVKAQTHVITTSSIYSLSPIIKSWLMIRLDDKYFTELSGSAFKLRKPLQRWIFVFRSISTKHPQKLFITWQLSCDILFLFFQTFIILFFILYFLQSCTLACR
jgi:hypothetical protein